MTETSTTHHLYCLMQNRLGAMDRVLGALTHRGIIPERMASAIRPENTLEIMIRFDCGDLKMVEKLVKFLQKQVYVMDARTLAEQTEHDTAIEPSNITPLFVSDVINDYAQRRIAHANNA
jgi:acetolactate synthase small subunit